MSGSWHKTPAGGRWQSNPGSGPSSSGGWLIHQFETEKEKRQQLERELQKKEDESKTAACKAEMAKKMKEGVDERMTEFFGGKKDNKDKSCLV